MRTTRWLTAPALFLALIACSPGKVGDEDLYLASADSLRIGGRVTLRSHPVPISQPLTYAVTIFANDGMQCERSPETGPKQSGATKAIEIRADGTYAREYRNSEFKSATHPDCRVAEFRTDGISSLRIQASIPATEANCRIFCTGRDNSCQEQCESGNRQILGEARIEGLAPRVKRELPNAFRLDVPLDLDHLSPDHDHGEGGGGDADLIVNADTLASSVSVNYQTFEAGSCAQLEGCISGSGRRRLLRFDTELVNRGSAALVIGQPEENPDFHFDACHNHHHLEGVMRYELLPLEGETPIVVGDKRGFCLMDTNNYTGADAPTYDCETQGISSGWADVYDRTLDCQWLDVTDVPAGKYRLRLIANPGGSFVESDLGNNTAETTVTLAAP